MSEFRDPREPPLRDPMYGGFNDPSRGSLTQEPIGMAAAVAWIAGILLVIGVMVYAIGGGEGVRTAQYETTPPAAKIKPAPKPATPAPPAQLPPSPGQ
jgi:hypothetical protein